MKFFVSLIVTAAVLGTIVKVIENVANKKESDINDYEMRLKRQIEKSIS